MKALARSVLEIWKQLGLNQRVSLAVAAFAVLGGIAGVVVWSQRPDYQLLYARLGQKDAAAVITALQAQGIPHQITAGGTAVLVPANAVHKVRMELASKGLPSGEGIGFEIFDKGQFGLSDFIQRTNFIRAMQGELARTIAQLQGVQSARVMIVQPENRLLLSDQGVKATASVFVDVGGGRLEPDQVNAIRHLVANSVQGLLVDQVAVIDNRGRTLSEELKQDPVLGTASSQIRFRQQVEDYLAHKVETMLGAVIGPGNAVVRVSAEIDNEASTLTSEKFDPDGQVIRSQTQTDDTTNTTEGRATGGAAGVSANIPETSQNAAAEAGRPPSTSEQNRKNRTTTFEINRTVTSVTRAPGTLKNVSAAVFVAPRLKVAAAPATPDARTAGQPTAEVQKRTEAELDALRQVVVNALGVKLAPGQAVATVVSLHELEFQAPVVSAGGTPGAVSGETRLQDWTAAASPWAAVIGAVVMLIVFLRLLKRQKPEPVPMELLAMPAEPGQRVANSGAVTPELLNELIKQKPTHISATLRDWVAAGAAPAGKN